MKHTTWLLVGILIIAAFFRLYHLGVTPPGLYPDEAMDGNNALQAIATHHCQVFYPENNGREGLFMNIQAPFVETLGTEPWVLRLVSAIFGILTVWGMYFLGRELFSKKIGLLAAFLTATSFWHIMFSRISFRAITAPFFLVWASFFFLRSLQKKEHEKTGTWVMFAVLGGLSFGLGFYSYIAYRVAPALLLLFVPFFMKREHFWKAAALFVAAAFFTALPLGIYFMQHPADFFGRTSQVSVFKAASPLHDLALNIGKTLLMFNVRGDENWRQNFAGAPELFAPVGLLFIIGLIWSAWSIRKRDLRFPHLFLFLWFVLGSLPVVISNEGIPHALRSILLIPPVILWAAFGGVKLYEWLKARINTRVLFAGAVLCLVLFAAQAYVEYFAQWANNPNVPGAFGSDYVALGDLLNALPTSTPKYVIVQAGGVLVNGIPMPAATVMYVTDTYLPRDQAAKNIHYVLPDASSTIPQGAMTFILR